MQEIRRCSECGKPITRDAQVDHILRKRNSLSAVNDTCARCNNRYLEKWDLSGELPPGPHDALLNIARRSALLAQWMGQSEVAEAARIVEQFELKRQGWNTGTNRNRRKRRVTPVSDHQTVVTAILDEASRYRQFLEYLAPYIDSVFTVELQILAMYARKVERNPVLFLEWWESTDHESYMQSVGSTLWACNQYDLTVEMNSTEIFRMMLGELVKEATIFLKWLHTHTRTLETIS